MALMIAVGNLQSYAGLDTRIIAGADILNVNNPPVLGVCLTERDPIVAETG